jgi:hypothetical protein
MVIAERRYLNQRIANCQRVLRIMGVSKKIAPIEKHPVEALPSQISRWSTSNPKVPELMPQVWMVFSACIFTIAGGYERLISTFTVAGQVQKDADTPAGHSGPAEVDKILLPVNMPTGLPSSCR